MSINKLLGKLKVANKLRLGIVLSITIIVGVQLSSAMKLKDSIISERMEKAENLVSAVSSQINHVAKKSSFTQEQQALLANQLITSTKYGESGYFFVFDTQGEMVTHPVLPILNGQKMMSHSAAHMSAAFRKFVEKARAEGEGFVSYDWPKPGTNETEEKVSFIKKQQHWDWVIGTGIYLSDVNEAYLNSLYVIIAETLLYITLLIGLFQLIGRNITKPLDKLTRTMTEASVNKNLTIQLKSQGNDELTEIAVAYNNSNQHFRTVLHEINDSTMSLASQSEELAAVTQQIKTGILQQNSDTEVVQNQIVQLDESSKQVYAQTQEAFQSVLGASNLTEQGLKHIHDNAVAIQKVSDRVDNAALTVKALEESSEQISAVMDVIKKVAEQTNLLALNAAIEAARAGEQGRGFTVVADEVRKLAMRTQESTDDIAQIIDSLHQGVAAAVNEMSECKQSTAAGLSISQLCEQTLQDIDEAMKAMHHCNSEIATAAQEQAQFISDVAGSMKGIAKVAEETKSGAEHTHSASHHLSEMSHELSQMIGEFKT